MKRISVNELTPEEKEDFVAKVAEKLKNYDGYVDGSNEMSMQEWAKFVMQVEKVSGIADMIGALEGLR